MLTMVVDGGLAVNRRLAATIAIVITVVWAISFLVDMISTSYSPPAALNALMITVAGAALGPTIRRGGGD